MSERIPGTRSRNNPERDGRPWEPGVSIGLVHPFKAK